AAALRPLARNHERRALPDALARDSPRLGEHVDVFLGSEPAHVQNDRGVVTTGEPAAPARAAARRMEMLAIDAPSPDGRAPDAAACQLARDRFAGRLGQDRRPMEPAQPL